MKNLALMLLAASVWAVGCGGGDPAAKKTEILDKVEHMIDPAGFPNENGTIFGAWQSESTEIGDAKVSRRIYVSREQFGIIQVCDYGDVSVSVGVAVFADISNGQIFVSDGEEARSFVKTAKGTFDCAIEIPLGTIAYQMQNDEATFTSQQQQYITQRLN
jgi:hypothetical protein